MLSRSFNRRYLLIFTIATAWAWWAGLGSAAKGEHVCLDGQCPLVQQQYQPQYQPQVVARRASVAPEVASAIVRVYNTRGKLTDKASGTLIESGMVVTCAHLFSDGVGTVSVAFRGGYKCTAEVLGIEKAIDTAVLGITPVKVKPITVAADYPRRGDPLQLVGYGENGAFGAANGMAVGYVTVTSFTPGTMLNISCGARQGDSGGPMLNANNELAGLLTATNGQDSYGPCCTHVGGFVSRIRARLQTRLGGAKDLALPGLKQPAATTQAGNPVAPGPVPGNDIDDSGPPAPLAPVPPPLPTPDTTIADKIRADVEAKTQAAIQAATKQARDDLGKQLGVNQQLQAVIDDLTAKGEQHAVDLAKQSSIATDLKGKLDDLDTKLAAKVSELTGANQNLTEVRSNLQKASDELTSKGGLLADAKSKLDAALPELSALKAQLPIQLGPLAGFIASATGVATGPAGWAATGLTILGSLLAGRMSSGASLKKLFAGAAVVGATAGQPATSPQAIAPPAAANGPDLVAAVKQVAQQVASNAPPAAAPPTTPAPAPPAKVYSPVYALNPAAANELADKRLKTMGMTLGQQGLLAQLHQEANQALAQGGFAGKTGADLADAIEHWVLKRFISSHGVRTSLAPDPVLPGQAAV